MSFVRAVKNFSRLRDIANILFKHGFGELVERLGFKTHLPFEKKFQKEAFKKNPKKHTAIHLREAMEEAGGAYVKLGQMLSLRGDLTPKDFCEEFAKLQDHVKPIPYSQVKKVIETDFGKPIEKIFLEFDKKPIAAASIAQVHKAKLKNGQIVAVKIQRPQIREKFKADIQILYYIAGQAEKYIPEIRTFKPTRIVKEFETYTKEELDFLSEARNIDTFYSKYKYNQQIKIPKVFWDYTTSRVLTMTYLDGKKVSEMKRLSKEEKKHIALTIYNSFLTQAFDMHVFHADPHPGNIFVLKNGKIGLLDFGIVGRLSPDLSKKVELMLIGLVKGDLDYLSQGIIELGFVEEIDIDQFKEDLFNTWGKYHGEDNNKINMREFFAETFTLARKYKIEYPGNFVLLTKAVITVQSLGEKLYPQANFVKIVSPRVEKILRKRHNPKAMVKSAKRNVADLAWTLRNLPQDLRSLMHIVRRGGPVRVDIENEDIQYFTREMDRSSNRIAFSLVISGITVTTGLIILANAEPKLLGIPVLAWGGFGLIVFLAMVLTWSIFNENKGEKRG
jgi:ubiquinone biosynthesis protein